MGASPVAISAIICRLSFSSLRRSLCWSVLYCRHCSGGRGGSGQHSGVQDSAKAGWCMTRHFVLPELAMASALVH